MYFFFTTPERKPFFVVSIISQAPDSATLIGVSSAESFLHMNFFLLFRLTFVNGLLPMLFVSSMGRRCTH